MHILLFGHVLLHLHHCTGHCVKIFRISMHNIWRNKCCPSTLCMHYLINQLINFQAGIPKSIRQLVGKLAECGWLYSKTKNYVQTKSTDKTFGLVGQSFCSALHQELTEYYRMIAVLEGQVDCWIWKFNISVYCSLYLDNDVIIYDYLG